MPEMTQEEKMVQEKLAPLYSEIKRLDERINEVMWTIEKCILALEQIREKLK